MCLCCNGACVPAPGAASVVRRCPRPLLRALVVLAVLAAGTLLSGDLRRELGVGGASGDEPDAPRMGEVVRVVDGDTIRVRVGGREERVRYIGIDTPESARAGMGVECFARRAAAENARLVDGRRVRLEPDAEARDRYGRLLAYVFRVEDGRMVNESLVRGGYAVRSRFRRTTGMQSASCMPPTRPAAAAAACGARVKGSSLSGPCRPA